MHAGPARRTEQKGSRNPSRPLFCALPDAGPSVGMLPVSYKSQTPLHARQGVQRGLVMRSAFVLRLMPKTIFLPFSCLARLSLDALRGLCPACSCASPLAVGAVSVPPPFTRLSLDALRVLCPAFSFASPLAVGAVSVAPPPFTSALAGLLRAADQPVHGDMLFPMLSHSKPRRSKRSQIRFRSAGAYDSPAFTLATKILSPPPAG